MSARVLAQAPSSAPSGQIGLPARTVQIGLARAEAAFQPGPLNTQPKKLGSSTDAPPPFSRPRGVRFASGVKRDHLIGFAVEQRWQGYVVNVEDNVFHAALYDTQSGEVESVELEKDEVNVLMRPLIKPGAILFFDIGYQIDPGGQKRRQSIVSLPMMPSVSNRVVEQAKAAAIKRFGDLRWGDRRATDNDSAEATSSS